MPYNWRKLLGKLTSKPSDLEKTVKMSKTAEKIASEAISPEEIEKIQKAALEQDKTLQMQAWLKLHKQPQDIIRQAKDAALAPEKAKLDEIRRIRDFSGFENWAEGGPTTQALKEQAQKEFERGKLEGVKNINIGRYLTSLSPQKKAAAIATATAAGLSLGSDEAEAGVKGSAAARKGILQKTEDLINAWTSGKKGTAGGRELRERLANQLDLDPTGTAKKEALRRLTAQTEVRQNPTTGEHEFKLYRGDVPGEKFKTSSQSFTPDPNVAQEFADAYGGTVNEVWVPASKIGSIPSIMKPGQYLSSEKEVITKPFEAESKLYTPKEESLHQKISKRGIAESSAEDTDDYISKMISEGGIKKKAAAGLGAAGLLGSEAQASQDKKISDIATRQIANLPTKEEISQGLLSAAEAYVPFSKIKELIQPTEIAQEGDEFEMLKKLRK